MAKVHVASGTEGSRHDPYSWEEITFTRTDGTVVVYRAGGLGYNHIWVDDEVVLHNCHDADKAADMFQQLTGMTPDEAEYIPQLVQERRLRSLPRAERHMVEGMMQADADMLAYAQ